MMKKLSRLLAILLSLLILLSLTACGDKSADKIVSDLLGEDTAALRQKDFPTPQEYYRAVEQRRTDELLAILTENSYVKAASADPLFSQTDLKLALDQSVLEPELLELVTEAVGTDLSWIQSLGFSGTVGRSGGLSQTKFSLRFNDTDIVHLEAVVDSPNLKEYFCIPELNESYLLFDLADAAGSSLSALTQSQIQDLLSGKIQDPSELVDLVRRYSALVMENVTKIELADGTAVAGGVSCPCAVATITIEGEDMLAVGKAVLNAALEDEALEKYAGTILAVLNSSGAISGPSGSGADTHTQYVETLQSALQKLEETSPEDVDLSILMTVTIDKKGEILGRRVELSSEDGDALNFSLLTARDGDKLGVDAQVFATGFASMTEGQSEGDSRLDLTLTGAGQYNAEGQLTGDFSSHLSYLKENSGEREELDIPLFQARVDGRICRDGFLGETELTPSAELIDKLLEELGEVPEPVVRLLRSLTLYAVNRDAGGYLDASCILRSDGRDLLTVTMVQTPAEAFELVVPETAAELSDWVRSINYVGIASILGNLQAAGVPASLLNGLLN